MSKSISRMSPAVVGGSPYQLDYAALRVAGYVIPEAEAGAVEDYLFDAASGAVLRNRLDGYVLAHRWICVCGRCRRERQLHHRRWAHGHSDWGDHHCDRVMPLNTRPNGV